MEYGPHSGETHTGRMVMINLIKNGMNPRVGGEVMLILMGQPHGGLGIPGEFLHRAGQNAALTTSHLY